MHTCGRMAVAESRQHTLCYWAQGTSKQHETFCSLLRKPSIDSILLLYDDIPLFSRVSGQPTTLHQAHPEVPSGAWHLHISPLPSSEESIDRCCGGWQRGNGDVQPRGNGTSYSGNSGANCSPRGVSASRYTCSAVAADQMEQYTEKGKGNMKRASLLDVATHQLSSLPPSLSPTCRALPACRR